jgi:MFS family permease
MAPPFGLLATALLLIGLGMGLSIPTMFRVVVERVDQHRAGLVGGMVNSTLQVSAAIGVAALGGIFYAILGRRTDPQALAQAFAITMLLVAICHVTGALLAAGLGQQRPARVSSRKASEPVGCEEKRRPA